MGFDHVLFLITLLMVAPLRAINGRWSLFQGWAHAARRFLAISFAFTLGHSAALLIGAYNLAPVPREAIEVCIAGSILIAAIHAIQPLVSGREWLVAAAFGTVHGLAFSEVLAGAALTTGDRALAVAGFNIGVEGAQLVAMACAVPLLAASRWRVFHAIRVCTMVCAALLAGLWMLERSRALPAARIISSALRREIAARIGACVLSLRTGNGGRVQWVSGRPGEAPEYAGTDFIIARDGRIAAVYLFFDKLS
jgi:hypothetical protein